ncbi:hypothetical protein [Streptomyces werraensis]|uniref:hypothetical protein n=1 Tax=Streptomyces werraensis TaxID=68284 RepID=UPI0033BF3F7D
MLNQSQELPWGSTVEKERHGLDWLGHQLLEFGKGFVVDGVWATMRGLGTLVGVDGWDAAGEAWKGLGKLATGLVITAVPVVGVAYWTMPEDKLPPYLRDSRNTVKEAGKALVAWDQWSDNPARAGGSEGSGRRDALTPSRRREPAERASGRVRRRAACGPRALPRCGTPGRRRLREQPVRPGLQDTRRTVRRGGGQGVDQGRAWCA